ncbi:MAG TPA: hypothetical protein VFR23_07260 [Jiangellaceae bacterium]|nr:hypothetical protein [Jiangellaceae bacterium]
MLNVWTWRCQDGLGHFAWWWQFHFLTSYLTAATANGSVTEWLLGEQFADGGWNCEAENGSTRSSFNTTICVLEALLEWERVGGGTPDVIEARLRGQEYLLERRLLRRRSGEAIEHDRKDDSDWTRFAFPTWWHYDVLRGLEYLRGANPRPMSGWPRRLACSHPRATMTADGRWRPAIPARCR